MAQHSDQELLFALVHESEMLTHGGPEGTISKRDAEVLREQLKLAEMILVGEASEEDRQKVYQILHPSAVSNYLS